MRLAEESVEATGLSCKGFRRSLDLLSLCCLIYSVRSFTLDSKSWRDFSFCLHSSHSLILSGPLSKLLLKKSGSIRNKCCFITRSSISFSFKASSYNLPFLSNYSLSYAISCSKALLSSVLFYISSWDLFFMYSLRLSISVYYSQIFYLHSDFMLLTLSFSRLFSDIRSFLVLRSLSI